MIRTSSWSWYKYCIQKRYDKRRDSNRLFTLFLNQGGNTDDFAEFDFDDEEEVVVAGKKDQADVKSSPKESATFHEDAADEDEEDEAVVEDDESDFNHFEDEEEFEGSVATLIHFQSFVLSRFKGLSFVDIKVSATITVNEILLVLFVKLLWYSDNHFNDTVSPRFWLSTHEILVLHLNDQLYKHNYTNWSIRPGWAITQPTSHK